MAKTVVDSKDKIDDRQDHDDNPDDIKNVAHLMLLTLVKFILSLDNTHHAVFVPRQGQVFSQTPAERALDAGYHEVCGINHPSQTWLTLQIG